jgi:exodeoxyribonuclease V beta subunit
MQPFDLLNAPLEGINLIEASAGTGKTYNIEGLFIRLVLEKQLQVDQILVLTFTNAATEELKERIRNKLVRAKEGFAEGRSDDPLTDSLVKRCPDPKAAGVLIHEALIDFDRASIFTIHGFCQCILHENAFETRNAFDTELITNQASLLMEVVDDFWRKTFYPAPLEFVGFSLDRIKGPEYFYQLLERVKTPEVKIVPELAEPALQALKPFRDVLQALKSDWPASREAVISMLKDPVLNARVYGSLKPDANHPELTVRDLKVINLVECMDHLADRKSIGFPLFEHFEKFTATGLVRATKKKQTPPSHKFFELCDRVFEQGQILNDEMEQCLLFLKTRLFAFAACELRKRKKEINVQHFDDLLISVKSALTAEGGNLLAEEVRQKYKAALVDEFQDTDDIQYEILSRLFSHENGLLFMIGDPKQAIYSFRGADIFSYMKAARSADAKFTLTENWRSRPDLIKAVNTIFCGAKAPFVFDQIPFEKIKPANQFSSTHTKDAGASFFLWYLDAAKFAPDGKPIAKATAVRLIANAVGNEILRLLSPATSVEPGDIAVLVRTNMQAQLIKEILTAKNVPSVLYTTANIFDSREALEVERVLSGIADPANVSRLKAAFATDMMGIAAEDLVSDDLESRWWADRITRIRQYFRLWERHGFIRMFRQFLVLEQIKERLLSRVDGERRLTNVLHLAEILHRQATEKNPGMTGLLKWLALQRDPLTPRLEENQLRLESDEKAVKIVTIHKSKGLEYSVVFCPFGWESSLLKSREFTFHDIENNRRLTFDLGSEQRRRNIALAQNEILSENNRLLYVALTRAKERCYLAWGRINKTETSAPAYLLHGGSGQPSVSPTEDQSQILKERFSAKTNTEFGEELSELATRSDNIIQVLPLPVSSDSQPDFMLPKENEKQLFCRKFTGKILRWWKISSYSSLLSTEALVVDLPDRDISPAALAPDLMNPGHPDRTTIYSFPKGTRAGSFFHDVFEHHDFAAKNPEHLEHLVAAKLQQYGLDLKWQETVCRTIKKVLSISLRPDSPQLRLSTISLGDRLNEMEFYFPLNLITPAHLKKIFEDHRRAEMSAAFPAQLEKLTFAPSAGFMKGYIDMVFQHQGRFYLVDWKSNHLGPTLENYDQTALNQTMQADYYILQYHIYCLALHQHLRLRKPDYRYRDHFGGVFYIFLRGVDDTRGPQYGIFFDLPDTDLIQTLGQTLIPGYP